MAAGGSKIVIYAALVGNGLIAITKFGAAFITGSSAMFSEAIHSLVDTGNQGLLLYGLRRAKEPASDQYPFGHGRELYFWAFMVAILIFGLGAGISFYEGWHKISDPHPVTSPHINYIVLAAAIVFEAGAWYIAFREFRKVKGSMGYFEAVRRSKDPALFTVLFEDSAAMLGLIVALIGIWLAVQLDMPMLDGAASLGIGAILAVTAVFLAYECKGLLIGEAADPDLVAGVRKMLAERKGIIAVNELRSLHFGPEDILVTASVDFDDKVTSRQAEAAVSDLERDIKSDYPSVRRLFIEIQSKRGHAAAERRTKRKKAPARKKS